MGRGVGVGVGAGVGVVGAADMLAAWPAPAVFTALTLKLWVVFDSPVKLWFVMVWAVVHAPLFRDTSYLIIPTPPVSKGACQFTLTWFTPRVVVRLRGAPGTVTTGNVLNHWAGWPCLLCHAPD